MQLAAIATPAIATPAIAAPVAATPTPTTAAAGGALEHANSVVGAPADSALPRPGRLVSGYDSSSAPERAPKGLFGRLHDAISGMFASRREARDAQLALVRAQIEAANAVAEAARSARRHW